jgi:sugar phosphate permease
MGKPSGGKYIKHPKDIFFGWWMALASGLLCLWGYGYHVYGFSALFKPISSELGFSRTATSLAASLTRLEGGLEAPLVGYLSDRYGPRTMVLFGVFLVGSGMILMNWVYSLWSFYLVWAVICATGINTSLGMPLDVALTNWFIKKRGTALGIKRVFSGLSGTIGLPVIMGLIVAFGWRTACVVGGVVMLGVGLPLTWFFIKAHPPEHYGLLPDGAAVGKESGEDIVEAGERYAIESGEVDFTLKEAFRTRAFWLIVVAYSFHGALYPVMSIHCIPFLTDRGMDPMAAAATMSLYITASIPARFFGGIIVDRVETTSIRFLLGIAILLQSVGVAIFLFNPESMIALYGFFILYGIGMGATMPMTPAMRARYFGRKNFGVIAGFSRAFHMPVGFIGPIATGWIYDVTGSYTTAFVYLAALLGISGLIIMFAAPPEK